MSEEKVVLSGWNVVLWTGFICFINLFFWIVFTEGSIEGLTMSTLNLMILGVSIFEVLKSEQGEKEK